MKQVFSIPFVHEAILTRVLHSTYLVKESWYVAQYEKPIVYDPDLEFTF